MNADIIGTVDFSVKPGEERQGKKQEKYRFGPCGMIESAVIDAFHLFFVYL